MNQQATPHYAAIQAENKRLAQRVNQLEQRIKKIRRMIKDALDLAVGLDLHAAKRMEKGNLPRAAWSFLKAMRITAQAIAKKIVEVYVATLG